MATAATTAAAARAADIGLVPSAGLGMAAARLSQAGRPARVTEALYCPPAVRDDPELAAVVQQRVDEWAAGVGLAPAAASGLGRLAVLAHPVTGDVGRLAVAARLLALGRQLAGGAPGTPGARKAEAVQAPAGALTGALTEALAESLAETAGQAPLRSLAENLAQDANDAVAELYDACDMPDAALPSRPDPARAGIADPALLSALAGLSALPASPYQVRRVRGECEALSSAAGRADSGPRPPWEYLSLGHVNAYSPALAALDAVGGYELSPSAAADPELRRAQHLAALSAALLHDIAEPSPSGLTAAIARAEGLGPGAAGRRAAQVHDEAMRAFTYHAWQLADGADPATRRYLSALWTWLGGHRTWHAVS